MDFPVYRNGSDYMYHNTTIPMVGLGSPLQTKHFNTPIAMLRLGDILVILGHRNTQIYK